MPKKFNKKIKNDICNKLSNGESLIKICQIEHMPSYSTVFNWLLEDKEFNEQYRTAREIQADFYVDQIISIADDPNIKSDQKRHQIDARKWLASKTHPRKWGDKSQTSLGETIQQLSDEQLEKQFEITAKRLGFITRD